MKRNLSMAALAALLLASVEAARAFCGFYVAKADTDLFNEASKVVLVRDGNRTVLTMANDYRGELGEFAIVIPVPTFIGRDQIHVAENALIDHLDAYTAPRLVEYFDPDPCALPYFARRAMESATDTSDRFAGRAGATALGVTIEAEYTVGEYDILILSAEQSDGLETWLIENGYRLPEGASRVLGSYIRQGMRFFVARVNLEEQQKTGAAYLRPLQIAFESPKFMLPIRLGMLNASGPQELFIFALTRKGRIETTNYRTVKLPTGDEIPEYVKSEFGDFYKAMFAEQVRRDRMRNVYLEYAWDMGWCDPCAADPLSRDELRELGVFWLGADAAPSRGPAQNVFVTRLHLRYEKDTFPDDLRFQETGDRTNFQGRYVLRHPWRGPGRCEGADRYERELTQRRDREAKTLASLTGWDINLIRARMGMPMSDDDPLPRDPQNPKWYQKLWRRD